jgi:glutathione synthase/RimK-type ligase-like ATP-grasp enzyme
MTMPRYVFRLGDITFSRDFIRCLRSRGVVSSRRDSFGRSCVMVNHGNSHNITIKPKVKSFYLINNPRYIRYCSNKSTNMNVLEEYYPDTYKYPHQVKSYPVVVKSPHGYHGSGVRKANNKRELRRLLTNDSIIEEFIDIKNEYRFNVLDKDIYQISRKNLIEGWNGRFEFEWVSLGKDAQLSNRFYRFVEKIIYQFHDNVGSNLGSYAVDVIKGKDGKYYLSEINSAFGIGEFTIDRLLDTLNKKYYRGDLEKYKVR